MKKLLVLMAMMLALPMVLGTPNTGMLEDYEPIEPECGSGYVGAICQDWELEDEFEDQAERDNEQNDAINNNMYEIADLKWDVKKLQWYVMVDNFRYYIQKSQIKDLYKKYDYLEGSLGTTNTYVEAIANREDNIGMSKWSLLEYLKEFKEELKDTFVQLKDFNTEDYKERVMILEEEVKYLKSLHNVDQYELDKQICLRISRQQNKPVVYNGIECMGV